jgi:DNA primase
VVVNYDPDSAGVAATERSVGLFLEAGFEVKVLALPGGLDPDSFIRREGGPAYKERLEATPTYLDYLTEGAAAANDLSRPEGKVNAANAIMPYLAKVASPMLRAELANRLAERLRLDERLLREEVKRVAGEGRSEIRAESERMGGTPTPAERVLIRAFLENEDLAEEFLPSLVEGGVSEGLVAEGIFNRVLDARRRGEKIELSHIEEFLSSEERRLAYASLLGPGEAPDRERTLASCVALRRRKVEREREKLQAAIRAAEGQRDQARLTELLKAKTKLAEDLARLGRG